MKPSQPSRAWIAAVCLTAMAASTALSQAAADSVLRDFSPTSEFVIWIAGKEVPKAELYESPVAGAYLLITSSLASPVLVSRRTGTAESINLMKVVKRPDGQVDLLADATLTPLGRLGVEGTDILFKAENKEVRFKPKPPLVGAHSRADLLAHSPAYQRTADAYRPDPSTLDRLKRQPKNAEVRIFFGSWCPHCRRYLPNALKLEELTAGSKVSFRYYGLDVPPQAWRDPEAVKLGVKGVPTAIVFVEGREVGRIQNNDWITLETSVARLVGIPVPAAR
ncbi:MAG TPA: thioredoxin family protein [Thermoanaerobaculia bacterium]|nr:thioredoxin family protein [Thermoanaerobaculia bacterium]